jgi:hypothetical protein
MMADSAHSGTSGLVTRILFSDYCGIMISRIRRSTPSAKFSSALLGSVFLEEAVERSGKSNLKLSDCGLALVGSLRVWCVLTMFVTSIPRKYHLRH